MPTKAMKKKKPRLVRIGWAPLYNGTKKPFMRDFDYTKAWARFNASADLTGFKIVPIYAEIPGE